MGIAVTSGAAASSAGSIGYSNRVSLESGLCPSLRSGGGGGGDSVDAIGTGGGGVNTGGGARWDGGLVSDGWTLKTNVEGGEGGGGGASEGGGAGNVTSSRNDPQAKVPHTKAARLRRTVRPTKPAARIFRVDSKKALNPSMRDVESCGPAVNRMPVNPTCFLEGCRLRRGGPSGRSPLFINIDAAIRAV